MDSPSVSSAGSVAPSIDDADRMEKEILKKLKNKENSVREETLVTLNESARASKDHKILLCSQGILNMVVPILYPRRPQEIIGATAFIASLSEEPTNRAKIVQSGAISSLVAVLKNHNSEACYHATRALWKLALDEENRESIGSSTGAISALVDYFCEPAEDYQGRYYAADTLVMLSIESSDNIKRIVETAGAVQKLLALMKDRSSDDAKMVGLLVLLLIFNLLKTKKGQEVFIEAGVVGKMVRMVREGAGDIESGCLSVMYQILNFDGTLFKRLAIAAGAEVVLSQDKEEWGPKGRDMAREMLDVIRGDDY